MLASGDILQNGRYIVQKVLDRGGMGTVYQAIQPALGDRAVAIKEMTVDIAAPDERQAAIDQFRREAALLATLNHPNLVTVTDCFEESGHQYLVMSLVDGPTLETLMGGSPQFLGTAQVVAWAQQVAQVLEYLHRHVPPVIFRDLKPSNIMLDGEGRIRLVDFGIARLLEDDSRTSTYLRGAGTAGFAPVEQYTGAGTDASSDVYAFGATLYRLLTRTTPPVSVAMLSGEARVPAPSSVNPAISPALEAVILKMMAVTRTDRYGSAGEAGAALQAAALETPGTCALCGAPTPRHESTCPIVVTRPGSALPPTEMTPVRRPVAPAVPAPLEVAAPASTPTWRRLGIDCAQGAGAAAVLGLAALALLGAIYGSYQLLPLLQAAILAFVVGALGGLAGQMVAMGLQSQLGRHRLVQALTGALGGALGAALISAGSMQPDWMLVGPAAACVGGLMAGALATPCGRVVAAAMVGGFLGTHLWHSYSQSFYDNYFLGNRLFHLGLGPQDWAVALPMLGACVGTGLGLVRPSAN